MPLMRHASSVKHEGSHASSVKHDEIYTHLVLNALLKGIGLE